MDEKTRTEVEAAAFRSLVQHFRERADEQNIDHMTQAGYCLNCLAKWYDSAAAERGVEIGYDAAREIVYGMPYGDWKSNNQTASTPDQVERYKRSIDEHGEAGERWFEKAV